MSEFYEYTDYDTLGLVQLIRSGEVSSAEVLQQLFNETGGPAMSVPLHQTDAGLPIGPHFAGRYGEDAILLQLANQFETARPWINRKPQVWVGQSPAGQSTLAWFERTRQWRARMNALSYSTK